MPRVRPLPALTEKGHSTSSNFSDTAGRSRMLMGLLGTTDPTITLRDESGNVIHQAPPAN
jgi:hypothetical protein